VTCHDGVAMSHLLGAESDRRSISWRNRVGNARRGGGGTDPTAKRPGRYVLPPGDAARLRAATYRTGDWCVPVRIGTIQAHRSRARRPGFEPVIARSSDASSVVRLVLRPNENAHQLRALMRAPAQTFASFEGSTGGRRPSGDSRRSGPSAARAG
jgi:hypothetical protein